MRNSTEEKMVLMSLSIVSPLQNMEEYEYFYRVNINWGTVIFSFIVSCMNEQKWEHEADVKVD